MTSRSNDNRPWSDEEEASRVEGGFPPWEPFDSDTSDQAPAWHTVLDDLIHDTDAPDTIRDAARAALAWIESARAQLAGADQDTDDASYRTGHDTGWNDALAGLDARHAWYPRTATWGELRPGAVVLSGDSSDSPEQRDAWILGRVDETGDGTVQVVVLAGPEDHAADLDADTPVDTLEPGRLAATAALVARELGATESEG